MIIDIIVYSTKPRALSSHRSTVVCVLHSTANQGIINGRASDYRTDSDYSTTRIEKSAGGGAVCSTDTHDTHTYI